MRIMKILLNRRWQCGRHCLMEQDACPPTDTCGAANRSRLPKKSSLCCPMGRAARIIARGRRTAGASPADLGYKGVGSLIENAGIHGGRRSRVDRQGLHLTEVWARIA